MHPIIALRQLEGPSRDVVRTLLAAGKPISQVALLERLQTSLSQPTLSRIVSRLVDQGIVVRAGAGRGAPIGLGREARLFAQAPQLRPPVPYDPARLGGYVANATRWLPEAAERRVRLAASAVQHSLDASTYSKRIAERFLIDLSWASSALEGNTYDYLETEALIRYGARATGKDVMEATMILNHKEAIKLLLENLEGSLLFSPDGLGRMQALLMRNLLSGADLGRVRANAVGITGTAYRPSEDNGQLRADLGGFLYQVERVEDPFEASFAMMAGLSYLQAFVDGNKRVGRLACNVPLLRAGLPPMSFVGVDKADYLAGLIYFYETADTSLLADVVSRGYEAAAPSYTAAVSSARVPRSIELIERQRIEAAIRSLVAAAVETGVEPDAAKLVEEEFAGLADEERAVVLECIDDALGSLNEVNAIAWGVEPEEASHFARLRDGEGSAPPAP